MKSERIAVIGGGLSGMLAAYRLSQAEFKVELFEKEKELGGELSSISLSSKSTVEKFYHHLFTHNQKAISLFNELELPLKTYRSRMGVIQSGEIYPFSDTGDLFHLPFLTLSSKIRFGLISFFLPKLDYHRFESVSAKNLIVDSGGLELWENFWEPLFYQKFGAYKDFISGTWFWARLKDRAESRRLGELLIYPEGGFRPFLDCLSRKLKEQKVKIKKAEVKEIKTFGKKYKVQKEVFDKVICTLPLPVFKEIAPLIDTEKNNFELKHFSVMTVLLETKQKISDFYWLNALDKDLPFGVMVEQTNLVTEADYPSHLIYLSRYLDEKDPLYLASDEKAKKIFLDGFLKLFPEAKKDIKKIHLFRDRFAQPIIEVGYQPPPFRIKENLFLLSSTQIYPYDRGIERTIRNVESLVDIVQDDSS